MRNSTLLERLKQARKRAGLTQVELASRLGRPQSYVSKYESGERRLDILELIDVLNALGVRPGRFVDELTKGRETD